MKQALKDIASWPEPPDGWTDGDVEKIRHRARDAMSDTYTERETIARYLEQRAAFWDRYPDHSWVAGALRNEAEAVRNGTYNEVAG